MVAVWRVNYKGTRVDCVKPSVQAHADEDAPARHTIEARAFPAGELLTVVQCIPQ